MLKSQILFNTRVQSRWMLIMKSQLMDVGVS
jgi:hypothetical protein